MQFREGLMTTKEVEEFIEQTSPHIKSCAVQEEKLTKLRLLYDPSIYRELHIKIRLNFWYKIFYKRKYINFIDSLLHDRLPFIATYKIIIL